MLAQIARFILSLFETKRDSETDTGQGSRKLATPQRDFYQHAAPNQQAHRDQYSLTNVHYGIPLANIATLKK